MAKVLTAVAFDGFKDYINRTIAYAMYRLGEGDFQRVNITRRERLEDGRVAVYFPITPQTGGDTTVTGVRLMNTNNEVWADKTENIKIRSVQEGALYRFVFEIQEKED